MHITGKITEESHQIICINHMNAKTGIRLSL